MNEVKIYMIKEIKIKIIDVLKEMNESKATILGVIAFLKKEEDAKAMLEWLEKNKNNNLTTHEIIDHLDLLTM